MTDPLTTQASDDPHERVVEDYMARSDRHARAHDDAARAARTTSWARLIVFVAVVAGFAVVTIRPDAAAGWTIGLVGLAVFLPLVRRHRRLTALVRLHDALRRSCEAGPARIHRRWSELAAATTLSFSNDHPFAADLHLGGDVSLPRLLGTVSAGPGHDVLAEWLLAETPPHADELRSRQEGIRELRPLADWRERLGVHATRAGSAASLDRFLAWAESDGWLHTRPALLWTARILAVLTPLAVLGAIGRIVHAGIAAVFVMASLTVTVMARGRLHSTLEEASARGFSGRSYGDMFDHARTVTFLSDALATLQHRMGDGAAVAAFSQLAQITACADLRFSPMGHAIMQALTLWDFHVVGALERWRIEHGRLLRARLRALGELEAHASLATLAHDNPGWCFPVFRDDDHRVVEAKALAHPLLSAAIRVSNDVTIGPPDTFLLVTGSNMAGKSTLLRSVALNVVLAQSGAPVCATELRLPRVRVRTSIHVHDALESGLSLFMVELLRLKAMVDAARETSDATLLYVADEMLRGTNMRERRPAVAAVLHHLLRAGAIGAVATHDLELAAEPDMVPHARLVHLIERFRDTPTGPVMWFDYRLRPGVATTGNALKLLELVGLADDHRVADPAV